MVTKCPVLNKKSAFGTFVDCVDRKEAGRECDRRSLAMPNTRSRELTGRRAGRRRRVQSLVLSLNFAATHIERLRSQQRHRKRRRGRTAKFVDPSLFHRNVHRPKRFRCTEDREDQMKKRLLSVVVLAAMSSTAAPLALAQTCTPENAAERATLQTPGSRWASIEAQVKNTLEASGYKKVTILPTSFVIQAEKDSHPILLVVNLESDTVTYLSVERATKTMAIRQARQAGKKKLTRCLASPRKARASSRKLPKAICLKSKPANWPLPRPKATYRPLPIR